MRLLCALKRPAEHQGVGATNAWWSDPAFYACCSS
jgi:hypothetical protein